jgi:hypothetical protein
MMSVTVAYDVIGSNISHAPAGAQLAGYVTGSGAIPWTAADWSAHPGAVRIAQSPLASVDEEVDADVLDVEGGAGTMADVAPWAKSALAAFDAVKRPGQRRPAVYVDASNVTNVANALDSGGVKSGVGLWVANWNLNDPQAVAAVNSASGPFPIIGVQFSDNGGGPYDSDVFSTTWLQDVSKVAAPPAKPDPPKPPVPTATAFGVCPAGGLHDTRNSFVYTLVDNHGSQTDWLWCSKCKVLAHNA